MNTLTLIITLFLIIDPIGNIPVFVKELRDFSPARQRRIVARELLIALAIMLVFSLLGEWIFFLFDVSEIAVRISAGVILFLISLRMLFPSNERYPEHWSGGEPFLIPLAVPALAGPSVLASLLLFSHIDPSIPHMLGCIVASWAAAALILIFSPWFQRVLTRNGLIACERLMGMILILMATQRFLEGLQTLFRTL